jgi:hypothetical protein
MARPTTYTQELADNICEQLALGYSLRTVCKPDNMPCIASIFNWFRTQPGFLEQYEKAKQESTDAMAEDLLDIADNGTNDYMEYEDRNGNLGWKINGENIQRSRLRADTRKWLMAKMKPKKYGDKIDMTTNGENINKAKELTDEELNARISQYLKNRAI